MGYISKDIAVITEPKIVTLSGEDNFVIIESKPRTQTFFEATIYFKVPNTGNGVLTITEPNGTQHVFTGTRDAGRAGGNIFYILGTNDVVAENLRQALLSDVWIAANYHITIPFEWYGGTPVNSSVLRLKSKGAGATYNIGIAGKIIDYLPNHNGYWTTQTISTSQNNDSLTGGGTFTQLELEFYENTGVFLGSDDRGTSESLGVPFAETIKTYAGNPVWFNVNSLFKRFAPYNRPPLSGWGDAGTVKDFRFTIKTVGTNSIVFYQSNVLYVLNGHGPTLERLDLAPYTLNKVEIIKPLTNQPVIPYVYGQPAFFNFLLSDDQRGAPTPIDYTLRILYQAVSQSGEMLGNVYGHEIARGDLFIANTCRLDIDRVLDIYPLAGFVKVFLVRGSAVVSEEQAFEIVPECLHSLNCFTFLNRLGGWDCFNFESPKSSKMTQKSETFKRTVTPYMGKGDSVETVYRKEISKPFTVESVVSDDVAEWLDEFASSKAIYDSDGNYIILEDYTLEKNTGTPNVQKVSFRYRLTESLNND